MPVLNLSGTTSAYEGPTNGTPFNFVVSRDGDLSGASSASYFVWHETTAPADIAAASSGKVFFQAGEAQKTFTVYIGGDSVPEPDEVFHVALYDPVGATIGANDALGVIRNDDPPPSGDRPPVLEPLFFSMFEGNLPNGSTPSPQQLTVQKSIELRAYDGIDKFVADGRSVISDGVFTPLTLTTKLGQQLSFTGFDAATATLAVKYTLTTAVTHTGDWWLSSREPIDRVQLTLIDRDGDEAQATLSADIRDDTPRGGQDTDTAVPGGAPATGNVLTDLHPGDAGDGDAGADLSADGTLKIIQALKYYQYDTPDSNGNFVVKGRFGDLTLNTDGTYSYSVTTPPTDPADNVDEFTYRQTDLDGGEGFASLTIRVGSATASQGAVITSPGPGSTVNGTGGNDTIVASQGADQLTGGAGADEFSFRALPWSAGRITDFVVGTDRLDFSAIFQSAGYTGADPVADGRMTIETVRGSARIYFDRDAANTGDWPFHVTTLFGVGTQGLSWAQLSGAASPPPPAPGPRAPTLTIIDDYGPATGVVQPDGVTDDRVLGIRIGLEGTGVVQGDDIRILNGPSVGISQWMIDQGYVDVTTRTLVDGDYSFGARIVFLDGRVGPESPHHDVLVRGPTEAPPPSGQVLRSNQPGDSLSGGVGADTLYASQGPDQLTGAGGADRFVFGKAPWNAGVITDFAAGSDKIDVSALLEAYTGSNPLADGWLRLDNASGSTKVFVDVDGAGGDWPFLIVTLQGVAPSSVSLSDFVV